MDLENLKKEMAAATRVVDVYKLQNDAIDEALSTDAPRERLYNIQSLGLSRRIELRHCEGGA